MPVQEHDALEAGGGERDGHVLDQRHEGGNADLHQTRKPCVWIRQRIVDGWRHERAECRRGPARHFLRNQDVGQEREVRPVLFHGTDGDDDGVVRLQEGFDFGARHLAQEHGLRLHS